MQDLRLPGSNYAEAGILIAIIWRSHGLSTSGSIKVCARNCSASTSSNCLHHVTRFDGRAPGPEHLQKKRSILVLAVCAISTSSIYKAVFDFHNFRMMSLADSYMELSGYLYS